MFGRSSVPLRLIDLLDEMQRRSVLFFYEHADPNSGLVRDRARVDGEPETRGVASIAATGFALSALAIGAARGYIPLAAARQRVETTLRFLARHAPRQKGFYYHFLDMKTGARAGKCELSSIDTAWLLCGVLHARAIFNSRLIRREADAVIEAVDWRWMLNDGATLSHGWTPEQGFLPYRWDEYSELLGMYLLALSSKNFAITTAAWDAWRRPSQPLEGSSYIESPAPLFVHQYSHAWFDFRDRHDGYADYFENSREATRLHREYCIRLQERYPWFGPDLWGITASDSRAGYLDWGSPKPDPRIDGTIVPCASGGSVVFMPDECLRVLETIYKRYGKQGWTRYGFVDAFHPGAGWYNPDVIGIDVGIMLLMAENLRTGSVWEAFMSTAEAQRGMRMAGISAAA